MRTVLFFWGHLQGSLQVCERKTSRECDTKGKQCERKRDCWKLMIFAGKPFSFANVLSISRKKEELTPKEVGVLELDKCMEN